MIFKLADFSLLSKPKGSTAQIPKGTQAKAALAGSPSQYVGVGIHPQSLQMYINADNTLSPSLPQALFTKQTAVQPHRVSLKPPFKSIHASAFEAQWPLVYRLSAREPKGFSPHCFHTLNKLFEGVHQLA